MMVLKAMVEISRSSIIVIKEVFANLPRIRSYGMTKSRCQLSVAGLNRHRAHKPVADRPQATTATWRTYIDIGLAGQARAGT